MGIDQVRGKRAVFLDRDGVLNRNVLNPATGEYESPGRPEELYLVPDFDVSLNRLQDAGYCLFLVSNQPNYAKGKNTLEELQSVHAKLAAAMHQAGIEFKEYYYCYHHPHGVIASHTGTCECRKPSPHFLFKAAAQYGVSLEASWMVGDRATDISCGEAAGVQTIRVLEDHPAMRNADEPVPTYEARDLSDAVSKILAVG